MSNRNFKIIAVDFDGTLCENEWPGIGKPNKALIGHLLEEKRLGNKLILWTCRCGEELMNAINWCKEHGLEFDAVNDNVPEAVDMFGGDNSRKVFADYYYDDKSILPSFRYGSYDIYAKLGRES